LPNRFDRLGPLRRLEEPLVGLRVLDDQLGLAVDGQDDGFPLLPEPFGIRHLSVGKVAPEIEGADQDGVRFKLSDHRGTVALLDFWSEY
jgi:hypothetical protein